MGFKGAWNKRDKLIEDLDTFLKLYKKTQRAYKRVKEGPAHTRALPKGLPKIQRGLGPIQKAGG
jgi:hypothetical protein